MLLNEYLSRALLTNASLGAFSGRQHELLAYTSQERQRQGNAIALQHIPKQAVCQAELSCKADLKIRVGIIPSTSWEPSIQPELK